MSLTRGGEGAVVAVWMDQGGTFTDVVRVGEDGSLRLRKVLSDQADLAALAEGEADIRRGTTVATNALLERAGARVLLIIGEGLGDLPWLGDQTRPDLFALETARPPPLCEAVLEIPGRIAANGELLARHEVDSATLAAYVASGIRAVAVVLAHGPLRPEEERRIGDQCRAAGFTQVSLGHEIAPSRGLLSRLNTTLADAALSPLLPRAPGWYMRSDGGLSSAADWRGFEAVLSGPAGGVIATAALAKKAGLPAFGFDMGGTSTDVCRVDGAPERSDHLIIGGLRLRVPAVRLQTVAAGGGSRLSLRAGCYAVGPQSAGADPGPACYGRGGPATVTDCEAALGRLPAFPDICGPDRDQPLDVEAARTALVALDPSRPVEELASAYKLVAAETMAGAVARLAASLGQDPAEHALVAFGGAGPGHALAVARRLGVRTVLVPFLAGAFSAVGIGLARRRAERVVPVVGDLAEALATARAALPFEGEIEARVALRHAGTSEIIELSASLFQNMRQSSHFVLPEPARLAFHAEHQRRFGFSRPRSPIELVELRVAVEAPGLNEEAPFQPLSPSTRPDSFTRAWFDGWRQVPLRDLSASDGLIGPAILLGEGTTVVVEPGWRVHVEAGCLRLVDETDAPLRLGTAAHPLHTALIGARLTAIAERMGATLARLARSVSIRERADFSCAVFDAEGRLVVNAPHIPVHLGAMGETVRALITARGPALAPGQVWVSNDPYAGGSHLPDITAIQPVYAQDSLTGFVAVRGHHVDVGGLTPGSMPPFSRTLDEEGLVLRHVLLVSDGAFCPPPLPGCREPETVLADLEAQAAACATGAAGCSALVEAVGTAVLTAQLGHLQRAAERSVRDLLIRLGNGDFSAEERLDDGTRIRLRLQLDGGSARLRILAPAHSGNLNAPHAVLNAALLYVFRCLVQEPIPLNEGALAPFDIEVEPGGLLDPVAPAAVAGGNVETSQRLVDALLVAVGACAASQGTMNNLTVGTAAGAWYETIGGGAGAGPGFHGASATQVHMTNTRATDLEELECRFPVRLLRMAIRRGSGGDGEFSGGDGLIKEWEFLAPAQVALLAGRRDAGAPGLAGGAAGAPGRDLADRGAGWEPALPQWQAKAGDRLRVETPGGGGYGIPRPGP